ncbi:MAG: lactate utilization protein [Dehalococcoidia bacterium]
MSVVSRALGRDEAIRPEPSAATGLSMSREDVLDQAQRVRSVMAERAGDLLESLAEHAAIAGWIVHRAGTAENVADVAAAICRNAGIKTALRSTHSVLEQVKIDSSLHSGGVDIRVMERLQAGPGNEVETNRGVLRRAVFSADAGITGGDYAIAETGTLVLHPRRGVSRLLSLAPPRHIAVVERGTVLPSLDELFVLERESMLRGASAASMNLISGPSRTGDIEGTIVTGIHGPLEVHMILFG